MDDYVPYPARIVVDANTIVAATLSDGITRELLLVTEDDLYAPVFLREEVKGYEPLLGERSGLTERELDALLERLFRRIEFLPTERTARYYDVAKREMDDIDPEDTPYLATALYLDAAIWSMDSGLGEQTAAPCLRNAAMVARVRGG